MSVKELATKAKQASFLLGSLSREVKDRALQAMARALREHETEILQANQQDLLQAKHAVDAGTLKASIYDRLKLSPEKLATVIQGVQDVAKLPDPVGRVLSSLALDEGLSLYKVSCPIGLIGVIFESRPDVVPQIVALAVKSGNAVILKGGKESLHTNTILMRVLKEALQTLSEYPADALALLNSREEAAEMLALDEYFDLIIPRGSNSLISYVKANTKVPVLGHADGVCHMYIAPTAELSMAKRVCVDAKKQYPAACNALETLLIDEKWPLSYQKDLLLFLQESGIELYGDERVAALVPVSGPVSDWHTEYGENKLSVRLVSHLMEAITHINTFGPHHTDAILTSLPEEAQVFMDLVDSAGVYHNASTRFADGFRYGFGAEVGISTGKTHARGPVGLEGLTIYKYKLYGKGQVVSAYTGAQAKPFLHKKIGGRK